LTSPLLQQVPSGKLPREIALRTTNDKYYKLDLLLVYNFLDHLNNFGNFTDIFYYTFCGELLAL
jgi:hypothetical protein